jgi:Ca2+-binding EF-hand superfamily protein
MSRKVVKTKEVEKKVLSIPPEQLDQYQEAFKMFDTNNTGEIGVEQIRKALKKFGQDLTRKEVEDMIRDLDQDGSGSLTFEEFVTLMIKQTVEEVVSIEDEVIRAFRTFDKDGNGKISMNEFRYILTKLGDKMPESEVDEIFKEADLNNDGFLNYEEFVSYWRNK